MATVATADAMVWRIGCMTITMQAIEAKREKTPMTAITSELRGTDFQNCALKSRECEDAVRFGIVFLRRPRIALPHLGCSSALVMEGTVTVCLQMIDFVDCAVSLFPAERTRRLTVGWDRLYEKLPRQANQSSQGSGVSLSG